MEIEDRKCVLVQSKISPDTAKRLDEIVSEYGFKSRYDVMQYVLSAFLQVVDCKGEASEEDKQLLEFCRMFEGFENAKNRLITVRPSSRQKITLTDSINIYSYSKKKGYTCRQLSVYGDGVRTNASVSNALNTVIKKLYPSLYDKLHAIAEEEDDTRIERIIERLATDYLADKDADAEYIQQTFSEAHGGEVYGQRTKRKNNHEQR